MNSIDERFCKIVREMDAELVEAKKRIAELESNLRTANFPTQQATNCGKCQQYKHTPWRDEEYGHVCATCLVDINDAKIAALVAANASNVQVERRAPSTFAPTPSSDSVKGKL